MRSYGNHDFDFYASKTKKLIESANYPILSSNIIENDDGAQITKNKSVQVNIVGLNVGVVGQMSSKAFNSIKSFKVDGVTISDKIDGKYRLNEIVKDLRKTCDIIIALNHGYLKDEVDILKYNDIDIVLGGHDHLKSYYYHRSKSKDMRYITHSGSKTHEIGCLEVHYDQIKGEIVNIIDTPIPYDVLKHLTHDKIEQIGNRVKGSYPELKEIICNCNESFSKDSIHEKFNSDFSFLTRGGIRSSFEVGTISLRTVWEVFPFDDCVCVVKVKGGDICEKVRERIQSIYGRSCIGINEEYSIATNDYAVDNGLISKSINSISDPKVDFFENETIRAIFVDTLRIKEEVP